MASVISTFEQAPFWNPYDPTQVQHFRFAQIPGRYAGFYYNKVPTTAQLHGMGATALPDWATAAIVGVLGLAAGFLGWKYAGPPVKKALHLSGPRRRRR